MKHVLITLFCLATITTFAQKQVVQDILALRKSGADFREVNLVRHESDDLTRYPGFAGLKQGAILTLDADAIQELSHGSSTLMSLPLPTGERRSIILDLMEVNPLSPDFRLYASDNPDVAIPYSGGKHYRGMIRGDNMSIVALSVFNDEVMGIVSNAEGNRVLGKLKGSREHLHILYNERDLERLHNFECGTPDDGYGYSREELFNQIPQRDAGDCVKVYIEIDDDIVTDKGGASGATNYITGLFNQAITLYANESILMAISEIFAWTTTSPYTGNSSSAMLSSYQNLTGTFNGNLSHLVSYQASGGIAAGFNGICNSNPDLSKCFSSIDATYAVVPTYSWSVMVITHEMGHLIGSRHTHACVWNGNNTAIDGCAGSTEGSCSLPGNPPEGGTLMSYCHLTGVGINFNLGFGTQPGNVIRNTVNGTGNCLTTCEGDPPLEYCASQGSNQQYEWIQAVALNTISNTSGNNGGYGDFTGQSTTLNAGTQYTVTLTPGFSGGSYTEVWGVWIDYNNDLDWSDSGEQVASGSGSGTVNASFTVPSSSPNVTTRMRVAMQYNSAPPVCGVFTYGEVEDYTVVIGGGGGPTCTDGIQNGDEEGVDCGGSFCPACPTCTDGIQNGDETGVDCGGSVCPACPTCTDGIQNGDETGVDCGGSVCPACPTCTDGIQNGDETGVDCGGSCPPCPGGGEIFGSYFESGWDGWIDGGSDCARYFGSRSWEGNYSINLQDNSGVASSMTSPTFNATSYSSLELKFYFYSYSMENGEDFFVYFYDGSGYVLIAQFVAGSSFTNNSFWIATVPISSSNVNFASNSRIRIQCDASNNSDDIYIDQVTLTSTGGGGLVEGGIVVEQVDTKIGREELSLTGDETEPVLVPNPATDRIRIMYENVIDEIRLLSASGVTMKHYGVRTDQRELMLDDIAPGVYILMIRSGDRWMPKKFVKM